MTGRLEIVNGVELVLFGGNTDRLTGLFENLEHPFHVIKVEAHARDCLIPELSSLLHAGIEPITNRRWS